jgi:hypothetical protein
MFLATRAYGPSFLKVSLSFHFIISESWLNMHITLDKGHSRSFLQMSRTLSTCTLFDKKLLFQQFDKVFDHIDVLLHKYRVYGFQTMVAQGHFERLMPFKTWSFYLEKGSSFQQFLEYVFDNILCKLTTGKLVAVQGHSRSF